MNLKLYLRVVMECFRDGDVEAPLLLHFGLRSLMDVIKFYFRPQKIFNY